MNLTHAEFMSWVAYRKEVGGFNDGERMEYMIAKFMALYANCKRDPAKSAPYTPYSFTPNLEEPPIDMETAMQRWNR